MMNPCCLFSSDSRILLVVLRRSTIICDTFSRRRKVVLLNSSYSTTTTTTTNYLPRYNSTTGSRRLYNNNNNNDGTKYATATTTTQSFLQAISTPTNDVQTQCGLWSNTNNIVTTTRSSRNNRYLYYCCYNTNYNYHYNDTNHYHHQYQHQRHYQSTSSLSLSLLYEPKIYGTIPEYGNGVTVGQYITMERTFTKDDVQNYCNVSGDHNPLHQSWDSTNIPSNIENHYLLQYDDETTTTTDNNNTTTTKRTKILVHGMLVSSMFTCMFGTLIPGTVYLKQTLDFKKPVYVNDPVVATITIKSIRTFPKREKELSSSTEQTRTTTKSGLIVTCDTKIHSSNSNNNQDTAIIEYVRGEAVVWMTRGVELTVEGR